MFQIARSSYPKNSENATKKHKRYFLPSEKGIEMQEQYFLKYKIVKLV